MIEIVIGILAGILIGSIAGVWYLAHTLTKRNEDYWE